MDGYFYRVPLSYFICVRTKSIIDSFQTVDDRLQVEDQSDTSHPFCLAIQYERCVPGIHAAEPVGPRIPDVYILSKNIINLVSKGFRIPIFRR